jgi:YD repeat-containing protein
MSSNDYAGTGRRMTKGVRCGLRVLAAGLALGTSAMASASVTYTYDSVGRIVAASYDNNVCVAYSYDANGNRLTATVATSSDQWGSAIYGCFRWTAQPAADQARRSRPLDR